MLSPLAIDPAHPFSVHPEHRVFAGVAWSAKTISAAGSAVADPAADRACAAADKDGEYRFLPLEELLLIHLTCCFLAIKDRGHCLFRVLRDSDLRSRMRPKIW